MSNSDWPNELAGTSPWVQWCNKVLRACKRRQLLEGPNYALQRSEYGTGLVIAPSKGGAAPVATPGIVCYLIDVYPDYIVCNTDIAQASQSFSDGTPQPGNFAVAKPANIRNLLTQDQNGTYIYDSTFVGRAVFGTAGGTPQNQVLDPPYTLRLLGFIGQPLKVGLQEITCIPVPDGIESYPGGSGDDVFNGIKSLTDVQIGALNDATGGNLVQLLTQDKAGQLITFLQQSPQPAWTSVFAIG